MSLNEIYLHKTSSDTLSVTSRITSDYFPQSYKRPAPYLLWDDNILPIHLPNPRTFSFCRLSVGILITVAILGIILVITIAVYLGVITSILLEEVNNEKIFDGQIRITQGDEYILELEDPLSLEYQLKAKKYETMLNMLLKESSLKNGYKNTEVTGFKSGSLFVFFRVNLDRRKIISHTEDFANAIHDVIALDASRPHPRFLKDLSIDLGSLAVWDSYDKKNSTTLAKVNPTTVRMFTNAKHILLSSIKLNSSNNFFDKVGKSTNASQNPIMHKDPKSITSNNSDFTNTGKSEAVTAATLLQISSLYNENDSVSTTTILNQTSMKPTTVTSPPVTQSNFDLRYYAWTPLVRNPFKLQNFKENALRVTLPSSIVHLASAKLHDNLQKVTPMPNRGTSEGSLQLHSQTMKRVEILTTGVAHEIPFSLDDLSFHDLSSHEETAASAPVSLSVSKPEFLMDANVATLLLLKPPISELNKHGDANSQAPTATAEDAKTTAYITTQRSGQQTVFKPFQSFLSFDGQSGSESYAGNGEMRISSEPVRRLHLFHGIGEIRTTVQLIPSKGNPDSKETRKNFSSVFQQSTNPPSNFSEMPVVESTPSQTVNSMNINGEVNKQSTALALEEIKNADLSVSINKERALFDDLMNHDWVTVPLRRHTVFFSRTTPSLEGKNTNFLVKGSEMHDDVTTHANKQTASTATFNIEDSDDQSDPLLAEEKNIESTSLPQNYASLMLERTLGVQYASCLQGMFVCPKAEICINMSKVCDSFVDCPQGEDEKHCDCGTRPMASSPRIVGGSNAFAGSWPWQAAMYKNGEYMCGATLINERWLISAAHCFYNEVTNHWTARLGMLRRGQQAPYEQIHQISHIIVHQQYIKVGFINDVAMLRMQSIVTFSDYIQPACLPSATQDGVYDGRMCTVVGWGQLMETGHIFPDTLQEVELPIYTVQECHKKTFFLQTYQITENMFCAGYDRGGRDACLGDSGGPLVCKEPDGRWTLIGITSNGFGCARAWRPGIYTKVANYLSWINQTKSGSLGNPIRTFCQGHRCQLGQCLPPSIICNRVIDCLDGSDEHGCS